MEEPILQIIGNWAHGQGDQAELTEDIARLFAEGWLLLGAIDSGSGYSLSLTIAADSDLGSCFASHLHQCRL